MASRKIYFHTSTTLERQILIQNCYRSSPGPRGVAAVLVGMGRRLEVLLNYVGGGCTLPILGRRRVAVAPDPPPGSRGGRSSSTPPSDPHPELLSVLCPRAYICYGVVAVIGGRWWGTGLGLVSSWESIGYVRPRRRGQAKSRSAMSTVDFGYHSFARLEEVVREQIFCSGCKSWRKRFFKDLAPFWF